MDISVGICCHNEAKNIGKLLDSILWQQTTTITIKDIIVVSSGSSDGTNDIVASYSVKDRRIKLVVEDVRTGKFSAINKILRHAQTEIILMESADTIPIKNAFEILCRHFDDENVGIVCGKPVPIDGNNGLLSFFSDVKWGLHHSLSLIKPKFGEIIAFRNIISQLPETAVDEEELASFLHAQGYKTLYEPKAQVYTKDPEKFSELIEQRRRVHAGHLELKKRSNWSAVTMNVFYIVRAAIKEKSILLRKPLYLLVAVVIEIYARLLGRLDYALGRKYIIWKPSPSTKFLSVASDATGRTLKDASKFPSYLYKNK